MTKAERDPTKPVYLRIGDWNPNDQRSRNYAAGRIEAGLSVYDLDAARNPIAPDGGWAEDDMRDRLRSADPKYLVQGDLVGEGHDGEPLLGNPRIVGEWTPTRV